MDVSRYHKTLAEFILHYLDGKSYDLSLINKWGPDVVDRLKPYVVNGKLLRGCLLMSASDLLSGENNPQALNAAAAIEILHSSLLIHDDIFDSDNNRRGMDAMHYQYEKYGIKHGLNNPKHFGQSVGACVGDIGFFMSLELLSSMDIDPKIKEKILLLYNREICNVGVAEIEDIYLENSDVLASEEEILKMYEYKTAHYTFTLPLSIGALVAGADDACISRLREIGKSIGLIYQIKDDELGIFGDEKLLGKSVGIDIKSDKKTLYRYHLFNLASESDRKKLSEIFGNYTIGDDEITFVKELIIKYGIDKIIDKQVKFYDDKARKSLSHLECNDSFKTMVLDLLNYVSYRKK